MDKPIEPGQTPLVSIIVPVYNVAEYLRECVESIRQQSYVNLEIILVDDGSTDGSGLLCDELAKMDQRIIVVHQENGGLSNARNRGTGKASGKYIWFVDSDDKVHPEAVGKCVSFAMAHSLDVVLFDTDFFGDCEAYAGVGRDAYHRSQRYEIASGKDLIAQLLDNNDFYMPAWMYMLDSQFLRKTEVLFVPNIIHEDNSFTFLVLFRATSVGHIYENLYQQRIRHNSITTSSVKMQNAEGILACMQDISRRVGLLGDAQERAITRRFLFWILGNALDVLQKMDADLAAYEKVKDFCADIENIYCQDLDADRVVWYGYGNRCHALLRLLQPYRPSEIWDMKGAAPARKPAFETLGERDALVVCIDDYTVFEEIERKCRQQGFFRVLHWQEYWLQQYIKSKKENK
jgi:glycosyltransferase involved in cell wall biosynthesis